MELSKKIVTCSAVIYPGNGEDLEPCTRRFAVLDFPNPGWDMTTLEYHSCNGGWVEVYRSGEQRYLRVTGSARCPEHAVTGGIDHHHDVAIIDCRSPRPMAHFCPSCGALGGAVVWPDGVCVVQNLPKDASYFELWENGLYLMHPKVTVYGCKRCGQLFTSGGHKVITIPRVLFGRENWRRVSKSRRYQRREDAKKPTTLRSRIYF